MILSFRINSKSFKVYFLCISTREAEFVILEPYEYKGCFYQFPTVPLFGIPKMRYYKDGVFRKHFISRVLNLLERPPQSFKKIDISISSSQTSLQFKESQLKELQFIELETEEINNKEYFFAHRPNGKLYTKQTDAANTFIVNSNLLCIKDNVIDKIIDNNINKRKDYFDLANEFAEHKASHGWIIGYFNSINNEWEVFTNIVYRSFGNLYNIFQTLHLKGIFSPKQAINIHNAQWHINDYRTEYITGSYNLFKNRAGSKI
ncbi:MAG: hypothetical protein M0R46_09545 [Candidatus Muirbacterium halophilum]|nr:hypothetical protein [Candidatus Muirbacterium halophilum]MCK9476152.1 hypothetical protein [Candidatus Muirbacterium halophilum]